MRINRRSVTSGSTSRACSFKRPLSIALPALLAVSALFIANAVRQPTSIQAAAPEPCTTSSDAVAAAAVPISQDPSLSVYPDKGPSGSSSTLHLWNFLPDQKVNAILRVTGDPVVATGTTDALGEAYLKFTVPQAADGVYWILAAQIERTCVHASVRFQIGTVPPTPTTTPPPPTVTPTVPPPVVTPTPKPPIAGSGSGPDSTVMDFTLAAAGSWMAAAGFVVLMASRRRSARTR